jgi:hypothetical protein
MAQLLVICKDRIILGANYFQEGVSVKVKGKGGDIHELLLKLQVREFPKVLAVK